jgi:hypothetical protein
VTTEQWRAVVGWDRLYEVSDYGNVQGVSRTIVHRDGVVRHLQGRPRALKTHPDGHLQVDLWRDGQAHTKWVARLVLEAFTGPCPPGMEACHDNGQHGDNRHSNLGWGTRSKNILDRQRHGTEYHRNRTHCPFDHRLVSPNLTRSSIARGHRSCLACGRAAAARQRAVARGEVFNLRNTADDYYRVIMEGVPDECGDREVCVA